jgi:hypothetical protein
MNDKMKTVREALEEAIAIDRRDNGGDPSMYTTQLEAAIAALDSMEAEAGEVVDHNHPAWEDSSELELAELAKATKAPIVVVPHPKAQEEEVELTEAEVERIVDEERRIITPLSSAVTGDPADGDEEEEAERREKYLTGFEEAIRHLASKYRLIPR